eukprot:1185190-Rhodomonas_salina.1
MELWSFSIQVKTAAQLHHSECFVGNGPLVTNHLLCEIIEWKLLEQAIKQHYCLILNQKIWHPKQSPMVISRLKKKRE